MSRLLRVTMAALVLLVAPPVRAQPADGQARALAEQGLRHYELAEYDEAIAAYKQAYRLNPAPGLLFNIAQCYRLKGDCANAATFYRNYLRADPRMPRAERQKVEQRIQEMDACAGQQQPEPAPATEPARPASRPVPPPGKPSERRSGRTKKVAGVAAFVAGLGVAATGVYFGVRSNRIAGDISDYFARTDTPVWDQGWKDRESDMRHDRVLAWTLGGIGAAALASGGVLYLLGVREGREPASLVALPLRHGAAVTLSVTF